MRKRTTTLLVVGLVSLALPAYALPPPPDTVLIHGFDDENNVLVFGTSDLDATTDGCDVEAGSYDYELGDDGSVSLVESSDDPAAMPGEAPEDGAEAETDDPCNIQTVDVTGPNGQVNHGQVVSSFVHALGEIGLRGRGCVARVIAQSEYGKGDQQIRTSEVEEPDADAPAFDGGSVDLETVLAACSTSSRSSDGDVEDDSPGNSGKDKGRPENPGNSENAKNKDKSNNGRGNGRP